MGIRATLSLDLSLQAPRTSYARRRPPTDRRSPCRHAPLGRARRPGRARRRRAPRRDHQLGPPPGRPGVPRRARHRCRAVRRRRPPLSGLRARRGTARARPCRPAPARGPAAGRGARRPPLRAAPAHRRAGRADHRLRAVGRDGPLHRQRQRGDLPRAAAGEDGHRPRRHRQVRRRLPRPPRPRRVVVRVQPDRATGPVPRVGGGAGRRRRQRRGAPVQRSRRRDRAAGPAAGALRRRDLRAVPAGARAAAGVPRRRPARL